MELFLLSVLLVQALVLVRTVVVVVEADGEETEANVVVPDATAVLRLLPSPANAGLEDLVLPSPPGGGRGDDLADFVDGFGFALATEKKL